MFCKDNDPSSMLLINGTGRGKLTFPQTVGVVTCGVTLIIENTLSLGSNQKSKFKDTNLENGPVYAF